MNTLKNNHRDLTDKQLMRYSRHIMLPQLDIDGQERIWNSRVLIVGIGGLGCAAAQYLASSGIGLLTLVDDDYVEQTNLQRQVLHYESAVGLKKVDSAKSTLTKINSDITINTYDYRLNETELNQEIREHDVVLDCSDNLDTRNQLNRICFQNKTPLISGAAIRLEGQVSTFLMAETDPCYQCYSQLFGEQELTCSESGVLSPVVGLIGSIQATECLKIITGIGSTITSKLLVIDAMTMQFSSYNIPKNTDCPTCKTT